MCLFDLFRAQVIPHMLIRPVKDCAVKLCIYTNKCSDFVTDQHPCTPACCLT